METPSRASGEAQSAAHREQNADFAVRELYDRIDRLSEEVESDA